MDNVVITVSNPLLYLKFTKRVDHTHTHTHTHTITHKVSCKRMLTA
jgi:hypothetical protein